MTSSKFNITVLACVFTLSSFAQYTDVINSNRPGASVSAFSVGTNVIQLEAGPYILNEDHSRLNREDRSFGMDFTGSVTINDSINVLAHGGPISDFFRPRFCDVIANHRHCRRRNA